MKTKITPEAVKAASAQYLKVVEWSEEDGCFVGRAPGLFFGGCHGRDERKVYSELCDIVETHVEDLLANNEGLPPATAGKHYSGKFNVRIGSDLHQKVALQAMAEGVSLNQVVAEALSRKISLGHGLVDVASAADYPSASALITSGGFVEESAPNKNRSSTRKIRHIPKAKQGKAPV